MHALAAILLLPALAAATPFSAVFGRAIGDGCAGAQGPGTCQNVVDCPGAADPGNLCPNDGTEVMCCTQTPCAAAGVAGVCRSQANQCPSGTFQAPDAPCPGGGDVSCCIPDANAPNYTVGQKVLNQAYLAGNLPYAWGGGSCAGPTHDNPPWQNGEIGFDCSGLVSWAICKVTGRDLFSEGLRVTSTMYCTDEATLKYKHVPFDQRQPGDLIFFGGACACGTSDIHHVAISIDGQDRMWNAPSDDQNKVMELTISGFGDEPCPDVIRLA